MIVEIYFIKNIMNCFKKVFLNEIINLKGGI
jgi:hypothetical protein